MDRQPTGNLVVNSVGDILRHEKLRRLEKVSQVPHLSHVQRRAKNLHMIGSQASVTYIYLFPP